MAWTCNSILGWLDPNLCRAVDHYCERAVDSWYAEPFNALSNLAFLIAGWAAWRSFARSDGLRNVRLCISTVALIPIVGLGSFTFHTVATRWAEWLDIIPIGMFLTLYLWLALEAFLNWSIAYRSAVVCLFLICTVASETLVPGTVLWGGAIYVPTVVILLFLTALTVGKGGNASAVFICATGGFGAAYSMRTIDMVVCSILPIGTHMMWHLINAALMYLLIHLLVKQSTTSSLATGDVARRMRA